MLNIFKKKQNNFKSVDNYFKSLDTYFINKEKYAKIQSKLDSNEYKNIIYYPSSSKEWFNNIYSYNKSYIKSLVAIDTVLKNLFISYFNMLQWKIKILFKRRRHNKSRYSANKIYVSRAELKHTNTNILIMLYTYNKQKSSVERFIRKLIKLTNIKKKTVGEEIVFIITHKNRLIPILKNNFLTIRKFKIALFEKMDNLLKNSVSNLKKRHFKLYKIPRYNIRLLKKKIRLQQIFFNSTKLINFNKSKFNNLVLNLSNLGLINFIQKIYDKKVEIQLVELKSLHLNSDIFSSAVTLKLRDRKNKAVRILRRAILQMVKIPDLHTLITFDDYIQSINKNNILKTIKQQAVTGVRFEASGRLTRRLTAMRAIFKYRYVGSLKNIRSSLNNKSSTMLRGYIKANSQYTLIHSKTRNGSFGLKGWVSSHMFVVSILDSIYYSVLTYIYNFYFSVINCNGPAYLGLYLEHSASLLMEALVKIHDYIVCYLVVLLFSVGWILITKNLYIIKFIKNKCFKNTIAILIVTILALIGLNIINYFILLFLQLELFI